MKITLLDVYFQSGEFLHIMLENLGEIVITDLTIPLAKDNLSRLVNNLASNAINKFERKVSGKGAVRALKFTLFISNEDMNDIIKIIMSLEDSNILIDGITETVKHEIKQHRGGFLPALLLPVAASLVQPVISSVVKGISGRGVTRAELPIISITNLGLMTFFQEIIYLE